VPFVVDPFCPSNLLLPLGTDAFTYSVSDGMLSSIGTITLNVGHQHDNDDDDDGDHDHGDHDHGHDHCGHRATVVVQSGAQVFGTSSQGYGYIMVNRGAASAKSLTDAVHAPSPELDWSAQADASEHSTSHTGDDWWSSLLDEPLVTLDDLARQYGLTVKKLH
jgi:hypothetical protein